jgi:O-antigen/teichoic acid export membrane protein
MGTRKKLVKGAGVLTTSRVISYGLSFGRNLILARILSKADFGLASLFWVTLTFMDFTTKMSLSQQIVQSQDGETPEFRNSCHALLGALGLISAVMLVILAWPVASVFGVPHSAWAFALLGLAPLGHGFMHLDSYVRQRKLDYVPSVACDLIPQVTITAAAWPLALWLKDFRVMLYLEILRVAIMVSVAHTVATFPYRWAWHGEYLRSMVRFGWPLIASSMLIVVSQHADRALIGACFSMEDLGVYSIAFTLVSIPWFIFAQVSSSLILPVLSRVQGDSIAFRERYRACLEIVACASVITMLPIIMAGEQIVTFFYGSKYQGAGPFVALLGAAFAFRFLRLAAGVASAARADTLNQFWSNIWRTVSLPLALGVIAAGGTPVQVASCAVAAELVAVVVSLLRVSAHQGISLLDSLGAISYMIAFITAGSVLALLMAGAWGAWTSATAASLTSILALSVAWFSFAAFRDVLGSVRNTMRVGSGLAALE